MVVRVFRLAVMGIAVFPCSPQGVSQNATNQNPAHDWENPEITAIGTEPAHSTLAVPDSGAPVLVRDAAAPLHERRKCHASQQAAFLIP